MNLEKVLDEVRERISPGKKAFENLENVALDFVKKLSSLGVRVVVGGSLAKKTMILKRGKQDIDIFVVFETEEETKRLKDLLCQAGFKDSIAVVHGSRDYFRIDLGLAVLEIVPVVQLKKGGRANNVTDYSIYHVDYVRSNVDKNPKIAGEILLAKAFCRAQGFYGAESYIHGFSGYSLEVLVIHFGSFVDFLKKVGKFKVIDPKKHFKSPSEALREINASKLSSPFVLVDPTYKYRNAVAGLSESTFNDFLLVSGEFLKSPSTEFFERPFISRDYVKSFCKNGALFFEFNIETAREDGNVAGAKCRKFFDFFKSQLERNFQKVLASKFEYGGKGNVARAYFAIKEKKEVEVSGPPEELKDSVRKFLKKNPDAYLKKGRYYVRKKTSVAEIFEKSNLLGKEIGARAVLA